MDTKILIDIDMHSNSKKYICFYLFHIRMHLKQRKCKYETAHTHRRKFFLLMTTGIIKKKTAVATCNKHMMSAKQKKRARLSSKHVYANARRHLYM